MNCLAHILPVFNLVKDLLVFLTMVDLANGKSQG